MRKYLSLNFFLILSAILQIASIFLPKFNYDILFFAVAFAIGLLPAIFLSKNYLEALLKSALVICVLPVCALLILLSIMLLDALAHHPEGSLKKLSISLDTLTVSGTMLFSIMWKPILAGLLGRLGWEYYKRRKAKAQ